MHNPTPLDVFDADIGVKDDRSYTTCEDGRVIESYLYSSIDMFVVQLWQPKMYGNQRSFNGYLVRDWDVTIERWFNDESEKERFIDSKKNCVREQNIPE